MSTKSKGALAMVLAGSVTFSVTYALLVDPPSKRVPVEKTAAISSADKKVDLISQSEKTVKDQSNETDEQTKPSEGKPAVQVALENGNTSDRTLAATQQISNKINPSTTTNPASTNKAATSIATTASTSTRTNTTSPTTKPAAPVTPSTSTTAPAPTTTPTPKETNPSSAATASTNRGQQVSHAAKEEAANRQDQKDNNGKKM